MDFGSAEGITRIQLAGKLGDEYWLAIKRHSLEGVYIGKDW